MHNLYTCNGHTFETLDLAIKYERFMRSITGIFYAIEFLGDGKVSPDQK